MPNLARRHTYPSGIFKLSELPPNFLILYLNTSQTQMRDYNIAVSQLSHVVPKPSDGSQSLSYIKEYTLFGTKWGILPSISFCALFSTDQSLPATFAMFSFDSWNMIMRENQARGIDASFNEEELELLKSRISRCPNMADGVAWWMGMLLEGTIDAIASVFLSQLWNIRSLDLIVDYSDNRHCQRIYGECLNIPWLEWVIALIAQLTLRPWQMECWTLAISHICTTLRNIERIRRNIMSTMLILTKFSTLLPTFRSRIRLIHGRKSPNSPSTALLSSFWNWP